MKIHGLWCAYIYIYISCTIHVMDSFSFSRHGIRFIRLQFHMNILVEKFVRNGRAINGWSFCINGYKK